MTKTIYALNLKNIVDDFQLLAQRHKQINSYGFGDLDEFSYQVDRRDKVANPSDQAPYYPYFYVVPANVIQEFGFMTYEFNLIVSDIMRRDMDNMTDVLSDTLQIMNDIISMFRLSVTEQLGNYNEYYYLDDAVTMIPFIEQYEDLLCGYSATIRIKTKTYLDRCTAAFDPFPPDPCCDGVITQYLQDQLQGSNSIRFRLYDNSGFTINANAVCNYEIIGTYDIVDGAINQPYSTVMATGDHTHTYNTGNNISGFTVTSITPTCSCVDVINP